jgi:hypothetical protein
MILSIYNASFENDLVTVQWTHDFEEVEIFNVIFDSDTSCSNFSVKGDKSEFSTSLVPPGQYDVTIKALADGKWRVSEEKRLLVG